MPAVSLRIDLAPGIRIGPGKIRLLELVAERGSIAAAGRALGMSYRRAWLLLDEMNGAFRLPVIEASPGGRSGGGASLTALGAQLVAAYRATERDAQEAAGRHLAAFGPESDHPT